ncbi:MAG: hypothetical protein FWD76_05545 [Firmicutes bacterium]|nr:hypothetical protein [Bacillota bacterium]
MSKTATAPQNPKPKGHAKVVAKSFWALTMLQLRNHFGAGELRNPKKLVLSLLWFLVKFAFATGAILGLLKILILQHLIVLGNTLDTKVVVFVGGILILLSLFTSLFSVTKHLYFDPENKIILTMPMSANLVFVSKVLVYFFAKFKSNLMLFLPFFLALGICNSIVFSPDYYVVMILSLIVVTLLIVSIAALLSIPAMFVAMFFKNFPIAKFLVYLAITLGVTFAVYQAINGLPEYFDLRQQFAVYYHKIQEVFIGFGERLPFMKRLVQMIVGEYNSRYNYSSVTANTVATFAMVLGGIVFALGMSFLLSRKMFFKMASNSFEYKRTKSLLPKRNRKRTPLWSHIKKELIASTRSAEQFAKDFGILIVLPLVMFFLNKIYNAMDLSPKGVRYVLCSDFLMMMLLVLSMNVPIASTMSREGSAFYHLSTTPQSPIQKVIAKISIKTVTTVLAVVATTGMLVRSFDFIDNQYGILLGVSVCLFALGHICWCVELDIGKPQWRNYTGESTSVANINELKAYGYAFLVGLLAGVLCIKMMSEGVGGAVTKLVLLSILFVAVRLFLLFAKGRTGFANLSGS